MTRAPLSVSCALALLGAASLASAQAAPAVAPPVEAPEVVRARSLFEEGRAAASAHRWEQALTLFESSLALVERPSTLFNAAGCLVALDRRIEAVRLLERYLATADATLEAEGIAEAREMLAESRGRIARIELRVQPEDAVVEIDGRAVPGGATRALEADPGAHVLRARASEHVSILRDVYLSPGVATVEELTLERRIAPPRVVVRARAGTRVTIDGEDRGEVPVDVEVEPGVRHIVARAEGRRPAERDVEVRAGGVVDLELELESEGEDVAASPILWTIVGVLVAGAAGTAIGVAVADGTRSEAPPSGGSTGVVVVVPLLAF